MPTSANCSKTPPVTFGRVRASALGVRAPNRPQKFQALKAEGAEEFRQCQRGKARRSAQGKRGKYSIRPCDTPTLPPAMNDAGQPNACK